MPQFTWHDGTLKYLHVDVHLLEGYQVSYKAHPCIHQSISLGYAVE